MDQREVRHRGYGQARAAGAPNHVGRFFRLSPSAYEGLHKGLAALYGITPGCSARLAARQYEKDKKSKFNVAKFRTAVRHVYEQGGMTPQMMADEPVVALSKETSAILLEAVDTGIDSGQMPEAMREKLAEDVWIFSGCKSYHELNEMSALLQDDAGQLKSFRTFSRDVLSLHQTYNVDYLEAEYEFAVSSSQAAAKWADITQDGDRYLLQYRTAGDSKVRESHKALNGITLPPSHKFWKDYMIPNGWRCRCNVVQVSVDEYQASDGDRAVELGEAATTELDSEGRNRAAMFRFNPGAEKRVFPRKHPYRKVPSEAKTIIEERDEN